MSGGSVDLFHAAHHLYLGRRAAPLPVHDGVCPQGDRVPGSDAAGATPVERSGTLHIRGPHVWKLLLQRTRSHGSHHLLSGMSQLCNYAACIM